jgi:hypothetical protein
MNARLTERIPAWLTIAISVLAVCSAFAGGIRLAGGSLGFSTITTGDKITRLEQKNGDQDLLMGTFDARLAEQQDTLSVIRADQQLQTQILCRVASELRIDLSLTNIRRRCP